MALIVLVSLSAVVLDIVVLGWRKKTASVVKSTPSAVVPGSLDHTSDLVIASSQVSIGDANMVGGSTIPEQLPSVQVPTDRTSSSSSPPPLQVVCSTIPEQLPSVQVLTDHTPSPSSPPPPLQVVSAARTLSFQGRKIRKRWSRSGRIPVPLFGQNKGKVDLIKERRERREAILETRRQHAREMRWAKSRTNGGFFSKYQVMGPPIGKGAFGAVYVAKLTSNSSFGPFAVKVISKSKMSEVEREIRILNKLHGNYNSNVVNFYEAHQDSSHIYIVTELCKGGNLYEKLESSGGKFEEDVAKMYMVQALNAVGFCHGHRIVHRDIKPEADE